SDLSTLSLHDALPIFVPQPCQFRQYGLKAGAHQGIGNSGYAEATGNGEACANQLAQTRSLAANQGELRPVKCGQGEYQGASIRLDRKSTRLNSSHLGI